ncbi:MAG: hypothetical protein IBX56_17945 [Methylomicrobium sp.]|nr:hypothetical protein [Methylomicrobium sp.]
MEQLNFNTLISDLNKVRSAIDALKEERAWLETAPANKEDLIKKFNAQVDRISSESRVIGRLFADMEPFGAMVRTGSEHHQEVDLGPVLCDLFGDTIKAAVAKKIDALDYEPGPPIEDRPKLLKVNAAQLKELEIAEENLICEGEKIGITVPRRPDVDPAVFLETHLNWPKAPPAPPPAYVDEQRKLEQMAEAIDRANIR